MRQFKFILIFFLFIVSTTYASVARPFNYKKWNFKKDIDLAYVLMHDIDNGILIKSQDKAGSIKSKEILAKLNALNAYCNNLQKIIKQKLALSRFQKEVELPLIKIIRKYKYLTRNYKNKSFIENPEYTKLVIEKIIKKVLFLESYQSSISSSRLKNVKSRENSRENFKKRIFDDQSSLKPLSKTNKSVGLKLSSSKPSKRPQGVKKCNKRKILNKYDLGRSEGEFLADPDQNSNELESSYQDERESDYQDESESDYQDESESDYRDERESDYQDERESDYQYERESDYQYERESEFDVLSEDQSEDEFFDSLGGQFS
ncbi:hypothetical protein [Borreliella carolinensis]|uniref:hypothetical protein n=1 Tax=Borreliella carolinensis TaxID=478174 RepID=UPI002942355A|nr:hypothetical protein [Borreliella carolinensis]WNY65478.1 hypothetical protein QIA46_04745 [Borreliella carolinensis]